MAAPEARLAGCCGASEDGGLSEGLGLAARPAFCSRPARCDGSEAMPSSLRFRLCCAWLEPWDTAALRDTDGS